MLTLKQAAAYLHISPSKCYVLKRDIPHYRIGGKILFRTSDLDAFLEDCLVPCAVEHRKSNPSVTQRLKCLKLR